VPYDADTPAGVMLKQNTEPLPRPRQFVPGIPDDVERMIFKALAKDPQQRYADMGALAQVLERLATLTPVSQAVKRDETTIDYGDGIPPSSSAKSAQSEKSAVQTSSTASVWEIPVAAAGKPSAARAQQDRTPTPPPYIPQTPLSAKSGQSEKSTVRTFLLVGSIGMGLILLIVIIGGASWLLNRPSKPSNVMNAETVQASAQETLSAMDKQTPTQVQGGIALTSTPIITNTPRVTQSSPMTSTPELQTRISAKDGMEQVYIPPGEFLMGSVDSDSDAQADEKPQHKVYLDGYWMDKTEVTNAMYQKCVADGTCKDPVGGKASNTHNDYYDNSQYANYPVIYVDWNQAQGYCKWAGGSLPSEAQWEKAARGTEGRKYPWGDQSPTCTLANYSECGGDTKAVGSMADGASPYGVLDMSGNVWEWVNDWYGDNYYQSAPQKNPMGPDSGQYRVLRGGSWDGEARDLRSAYRSGGSPGSRGSDGGFRCVGF
ncbi:MAG: SUMF1/EgtB/PvdO family nonheme iron enzyme, partial [Chloroflexota bacterium]